MSEEGEDAANIERLLAAVQAQQRSIDRLVRLVEQRERDAWEAEARQRASADKPQPEPARRPIDWNAVAGRDRLLAWQGLAAFVENLVFQYNLQLQVRPCWWQHQNVVEELTALWHMRQASFGESADLRSAMAWQDSVAKVVDRLVGVFVSCRSGHVEANMTTWMTDSTRHEFLQNVRNDVLSRVPDGEWPADPAYGS
jgi:hypothetical protein